MRQLLPDNSNCPCTCPAGASEAQAPGAQQGKPAAPFGGPTGRPDLSRTTAVPLARSSEAAAQPNPPVGYSVPPEAQAQQQQAPPDELATPQAALAAAHAATKLPGSSTACVMRLAPDRRHLMAANVVSALLSSQQLTKEHHMAAILHRRCAQLLGM